MAYRADQGASIDFSAAYWYPAWRREKQVKATCKWYSAGTVMVEMLRREGLAPTGLDYERVQTRSDDNSEDYPANDWSGRSDVLLARYGRPFGSNTIKVDTPPLLKLLVSCLHKGTTFGTDCCSILDGPCLPLPIELVRPIKAVLV